MGKKSKQKGYTGEKEFAELVGGKRIPASGIAKDFQNDVVLPNDMRAEVKRRKSGLKTIYKWMEQGIEKPDLVAFREDRNEWLITMKIDTFLIFLKSHLEKLNDNNK